MVHTVKSRSKTELIDITSEIQQIIRSAGVENGLCMLYVPHTTAAVTINESADPSVRADILMILNKVIPWEAGYKHLEGNSELRHLRGDGEHRAGVQCGSDRFRAA